MDPDSVTAADVLDAIRKAQEEDIRMSGEAAVDERDEARVSATRLFHVRQLKKQTDTFRKIMAVSGNPGLKQSERTTTGPPGGAGILARLAFQPKTTPVKSFWPIAIEEPLRTSEGEESKTIVLTPNGEWWRAGYTPATSQSKAVYGLLHKLKLTNLKDPDRYSSIRGNVLNTRIDWAVIHSIAELMSEHRLDHRGFLDT